MPGCAWSRSSVRVAERALLHRPPGHPLGPCLWAARLCVHLYCGMPAAVVEQTHQFTASLRGSLGALLAKAKDKGVTDEQKAAETHKRDGKAI